MFSFRNISSLIVLFSMSSVSCYAEKLVDDIANRHQEGIVWRIERNAARLEVCPTDLELHYSGKIKTLIDILGVIIHSNDSLADCKAFGYTGLFQKSSQKIKDFKKTSPQPRGSKRSASVLTNKNTLGKSQGSSLKRRRVSVSPHEEFYSNFEVQEGYRGAPLPGIQSFFFMFGNEDITQPNVEMPTSPLSPQMTSQTVNAPKGKTQEQRTKRKPTIKGRSEKKTTRTETVANLLNGPDRKSVKEIAAMLGIAEKNVLNHRAVAVRQGLLTEEDIKAVYTRKPRGMGVSPIKITPSVLDVANWLNEGKSIQEIATLRGNKVSYVRNLRFRAKNAGLLNDSTASYDPKTTEAYEKYKKSTEE